MRKVRYTLGQYGALTLDEARRAGRKILGRVADGEDPALERRAKQTHANLQRKPLKNSVTLTWSMLIRA